jgi:hypothetical protein
MLLRNGNGKAMILYNDVCLASQAAIFALGNIFLSDAYKQLSRQAAGLGAKSSPPRFLSELKPFLS